MLLQRLSEYADRLDLPPAMYQPTRLRWLIDLDGQGKFLQFVPLDDGTSKRPGRDWLTPHVGRTVSVRSKLLADTGEYVLGIPREKSKPERVAECHADFCRVVRHCAEATQAPQVLAVQRFLDGLQHSPVPLPDGFDPGDVLTFRVEGEIPIDLPLVQEFWPESIAGEKSRRMTCIVCGQQKNVEDRQPLKVKGILGGQTSGTALISANKKAFESYGLEASFIAPTCHVCAERFANALNTLLREEATHIGVGPLAYVFWTKEEVEFDFHILSHPDADQVRLLIESAWKGRESKAVDQTAFYAAALSASGGRVVVRDWLETTVGAVKSNLARWFAIQHLVALDGQEGDPCGIYALAGSLYRDASKEMVANAPVTLLRTALYGSPLPEWLLYQAVRRNRAEQTVTRPRMVLTKMLLTQLEDWKEDTMEQLELSNHEPAYLCGRLLAELEQAQKLAIPEINQTLVDRYFGTASSAPATVFGHLLRSVQPHLAKLRKTREGAYHGLQQRIEGIVKDLPAFPKTLTLKEQALFSLGYYHQRAADRAAARARKEEKEADNHQPDTD